MKITLTCAEANKILCEAVKKKYESSFIEAHDFKTYESSDKHATFDVEFDGALADAKGWSDGEVHFEAVNIKRASDKPEMPEVAKE